MIRRETFLLSLFNVFDYALELGSEEEEEGMASGRERGGGGESRRIIGNEKAPPEFERVQNVENERFHSSALPELSSSCKPQRLLSARRTRQCRDE